MDKNLAQDKVQQLVEKFRREQAAGVIGQYNEPETKTGFIDRYFNRWDGTRKIGMKSDWKRKSPAAV